MGRGSRSIFNQIRRKITKAVDTVIQIPGDIVGNIVDIQESIADEVANLLPDLGSLISGSADLLVAMPLETGINTTMDIGGGLIGSVIEGSLGGIGSMIGVSGSSMGMILFGGGALMIILVLFLVLRR